MKINLSTNIDIEVESCNFRRITISFLHALRPLFELYVEKVLLHYFKLYYYSGKLNQIVGSDIIKLKTTRKKTKFKTFFGNISIAQIRVYDSERKEHP
jgi:hypothetical protein